MKKYTAVLIPLILLLSFHPVMAQSKACCMPDDGYWQLVTRKDDPRSAIVQFYDLSGHLIYQERMTMASGWHRKKLCRALNRGLQAALTAYRGHRPLTEDSGFVTVHY